MYCSNISNRVERILLSIIRKAFQLSTLLWCHNNLESRKIALLSRSLPWMICLPVMLNFSKT